MRLALPLALLAACQPDGTWPDELPDDCLDQVPLVGTVVVSPWCSGAQTAPGGEARVGDLVVANAWVQLAFRHPAHALTVPGIGGGTLIDGAPWGHADTLYEAIPLVDGGWLQIDRFEPTEDGLVVEGAIRPLPGRTASAGRATVTWRLDRHRPRLHLTGADGLWLHTRWTQTPVDGVAEGPDATWLTDGVLREDLGGAVILDGVTAIDLVPTDQRWVDSPGAVHVSGAAPGATAMELGRGGTVAHRVAIADGGFDVWVPGDIDAVRAVAPDRAASAWEAPGEDLALTVGERGYLYVTGPTGQDVGVRWWSDDGRAGTTAVRVGEVVSVGAGPVWVELGGDVLSEPTRHRVEVPVDGGVAVAVRRGADTGAWVPVALTERADRDAGLRRDSRATALAARGAGMKVAVLTAENEVADLAWAGLLQGRGSTLAGDGWAVTSWPWASTARLAAHGALDPGLVPLDDAVAAMRGGPGTNRTTVADFGWLDAIGPWDEAVFPPDGVELPDPGLDPLASWAPWLTLDAPPSPIGPVTWIEVADPDRVGFLDVQRAVGTGRTVASTGPLLRMWVDGEEATELPQGPATVRLTWKGVLDHLVVLVDGAVVATWEAPFAPPIEAEVDGSRVQALGWSLDGEEWAATAPILRPPPE